MLRYNKLFYTYFFITIIFNNFMIGKDDVINRRLEQIVEALNKVIKNNFTQHEKMYLDRILRERKRMSKDMFKVKNVTVAYMESRFSIPHYPWGCFLFSLVKTIKPNSFLELGTCIGISGSYSASALEVAKKGKFLTLENFEPLVPVASHLFENLQLQRARVLSGNIKNNIFKSIGEIAPFDIVFDDHIHKEKEVFDNFELLYPYLNNSALYLFDDIDHNDEMKSVWKRIKEDERVNVTISLALGVPYNHPKDYDGVVRPRIGIALITKDRFEDGSDKKNIEIKIDSLNNCKGVYLKNGLIYVEKK